VGEVIFEPGESDAMPIGVDPARGFAYFGAGRQLVQVRLGRDGVPASRVGSIPFGEFQVTSGTVDAEWSYAIIATEEGSIHKVRLGSGTQLPSIVGSIRIPERLGSPVLDPTNHCVYFWNDFRGLYKVSIGAGNSAPRLVARLELPESEAGLRGLVLDPAQGLAWFAPRRGGLVTVRLGGADAAPVRVGATPLGSGAMPIYGRDAAGYAYFGRSGLTNEVLKVRLGGENEPPRVVATVPVGARGDYLVGGVLDPVGGTLLLGFGTQRCRLVRLRLGTGDEPPVVVGSGPIYTRRY
jgi:hypothetical protein